MKTSEALRLVSKQVAPTRGHWALFSRQPWSLRVGFLLDSGFFFFSPHFKTLQTFSGICSGTFHSFVKAFFCEYLFHTSAQLIRDQPLLAFGQILAGTRLSQWNCLSFQPTSSGTWDLVVSLKWCCSAFSWPLGLRLFLWNCAASCLWPKLFLVKLADVSGQAAWAERTALNMDPSYWNTFGSRSPRTAVDFYV